MKFFRFPVLVAISMLPSAEGWTQDSGEAKSVLTDPARSGEFAIVSDMVGGKWAPLVEGAHLYTNSERYQWADVPPSFAGLHFLSLPIHQGFLEFEVASDGLVFLVTSTRWGGGGNSSGDWQGEVMLEKDLRETGWRALKNFGGLISGDPGEMAIFWRHGKRGEKFRIRTEKYVAPMLLMRPIL